MYPIRWNLINFVCFHFAFCFVSLLGRLNAGLLCKLCCIYLITHATLRPHTSPAHLSSFHFRSRFFSLFAFGFLFCLFVFLLLFWTRLRSTRKKKRNTKQISKAKLNPLAYTLYIYIYMFITTLTTTRSHHSSIFTCQILTIPLTIY